MTDDRETNGMSKGPKKIALSSEELSNISKEELIQKWKSQEEYVEYLEEKLDTTQALKNENALMKQTDEKLRRQISESNRKENMLLMRLTQKETENHELGTKVQELKDSRTSANQQLRMMLLDPAVNVMFQRMKKELQDYKKKLEQTQNDLTAWKFTPDSQTGKRLMARIRLLLQENEELGKMIHSGRTAKLESEIALEKKLVQEMKKSQAEFDEFLVEIDEETEGMQSTIYILQQQLKEAREVIQQLTQELEPVKPGAAQSILNRIRLESTATSASNVSLKPEPATNPASGDRDSVVPSSEAMSVDQTSGGDTTGLCPKVEPMDVDEELARNTAPNFSPPLVAPAVNGADSDSADSPPPARTDSSHSSEARTTRRAVASNAGRTSDFEASALTSDVVSTRTGSKNTSCSS